MLGKTPATTATITTSDGVTLYAATIGRGPIGLVMAEDVPHSICEELPEAELFAQHGFRVEVFDWRDRGSSGTSGANPGRLDRDVDAAAAALRSQGSRCVALAGSYGGAAAAIVAAVSMHPAPVALVAFDPAALRGQYIEGPFGPEGALSAAPRLRIPVMYVTLQGDRFVPVPEVRRLERATGSSVVRLLVVPSGLIGFGLLDLSPASARVQRAVFSFLRTNARC
ncbi:MAG TPA: alpha/beta fold hydrolase [Actinomycetota bacterium]